MSSHHTVAQCPSGSAPWAVGWIANRHDWAEQKRMDLGWAWAHFLNIYLLFLNYDEVEVSISDRFVDVIK